MAETAAPMTRRELEEKIVARAWKDEEFRAKFLADPKAEFEAHLGTKLPETLTITAHEETPESVHFVIPARPKANVEELSDAELEKVAGGVDVLLTAMIVATAIASAAATAFTAVVSQGQTDWGD